MLPFATLGELVRNSLDSFSGQACDDLLVSRSYPELKRDAEHIEQQLLAIGVEQSDRVCLYVSKNTQSYAALLALVLSGVCYIPIDPLAPSARAKEIIHDSAPAGILLDATLFDDIGEEFQNISVHPVEGTSLIFVGFSFEKQTGSDSKLAYILYTSGSTGKPKGVLITHENALSFINWVVITFDLSASDTFSSIAPFHFDLSVFDLFVSLYHGAKVVLFNDKHIRNPLLLAAQIEEHNISVWYSTPTILVLLEQYGKLYKYAHLSMRVVLFAGEVLPLSSLIKIKSHWHKAKLYNLYGPTETNVVTWIKIDDALANDYDVSRIGQCCEHAAVAILKMGEIKPLRLGLEGELLVSGVALSPGYLNNDTMDLKHTIHCDSVRWYKTGDHVRVIDQLCLKYIGRLDRMIKKRGYRIELDEIQQTIDQCVSVERAGVISVDRNKTPFIIAFYKDQNSTFNETEATDNSLQILGVIQAYVKERLPNYMWPDQWICLDSLPLTGTDKIDYKALADYDRA
ncbi:AMP-binding protein [Arenicella xantha]|uniref:L-prolyl-[peptidyl carrier protein] synthetase n=1 Tax=Arenicella xantha TaxID=644221 RepID=A0A395JN36_9GAMM|nr:AMP-binding protein [Arenicella xantha]RBP52969.1 L-prolyl-[peptidyl carrier protein] synthetase [Arenicella xantha]